MYSRLKPIKHLQVPSSTWTTVLDLETSSMLLHEIDLRPERRRRRRRRGEKIELAGRQAGSVIEVKEDRVSNLFL